ncbi:hypothetical protein [Campylobacter curvus]|uniref:hypothetical protein n=1 Tax=Campylobacter curvus TaxID=200 RepID=UPI00146FCC32|nr:hypothetical protein [Campylobacter curvus]
MDKTMKIYVCSPYTKLLRDCGEHIVKIAAIDSMQRANLFFGNTRVEFFSPVLANMYRYESMSHDEVMQICFAQIKSCDAIFIPYFCKKEQDKYVRNSKGIHMEYRFAKQNNIPVYFANEKMRGLFEKVALKGENNG